MNLWLFPLWEAHANRMPITKLTTKLILYNVSNDEVIYLDFKFRMFSNLKCNIEGGLRWLDLQSGLQIVELELNFCSLVVEVKHEIESNWMAK